MNAASNTKRPLRLLIDGHTFDVGPQGTTTFLAGLLNALPEAAELLGLPVPEIYCACSKREAAERYLGIPFEHVPIRTGFLIRNAFELPRVSYRLRPDATISQYVRPLWLMGKSSSVIHDVLFLDFPELFSWSYRTTRRLLFGWSARHSDSVFTVSAYSRGRLSHWFGLQGSRIRVVPNGVHLPNGGGLRALAPEAGRIALLYVSRLEQRKRQDWCVTAVEQLASQGRDVELILVGSGEGPYADQVRAMVKKAKGDGHSICLHESISNSELDALMSRASIALFPSQGEGFGIPVIEACARGIPCVVADNTALAELRHWFAGPTFASESYSDFLEKLSNSIEGIEALRADAVQRASRVQKAFAWPAIASSFLAGLTEDIAR